MFLSLDLYIWS